MSYQPITTDDEPKGLARAQVYKILDGERDYQDRRAKEIGWNHQGVPSIEAELLMMEECILKARAAWYCNSDNNVPLDILRKVVATGVRCFENHGVPERK